MTAKALQQGPKSIAFRGRDGNQHPNHACLRRGSRRLDRRLHGDHRNRQRGPQRLGGRGGAGVRRDHDCLRILPEQEIRDGPGSPADLFDRLVAPGGVLRVGDIEEVLVRQLAPDFAQHRETAHAGIENTDWRVAVRHVRKLTGG